MAYTPTEWVSGTIITASKLNNIERGVESVNSEYTPTTWVEGDTVTAAKLNKIEQGIANASGGGSSDISTATVTIVNFTDEIGFGGAFCANMTYGDIGECSSSGPTSSPATIILYKGKAFMWATNPAQSISGDIEALSEDPEWVITGDCTITF